MAIYCQTKNVNATGVFCSDLCSCCNYIRNHFCDDDVSILECEGPLHRFLKRGGHGGHWGYSVGEHFDEINADAYGGS